MNMGHLRTVLVLFGAIGGTASAFAADLGIPPVPPPEPIPPIFTWTGPYAGVNAGYALGRLRTKVGWAGRGGYTAADPAFTAVLGHTSRDRGGFTGGAQAGYNYQTGVIVLGVEADINALKMRRDAIAFARYANGETGDTIDAAMRSGQSLHWVATLRPRIGWAVFDRFMVYGTGGLAVARASQRSLGFLAITEASAAPAQANAAATAQTISHFGTMGRNGSGYRFGWTLGGGAEYAVTDQISMKGEFLHIHLKARNVAAAPLDPATEGVAFGARNSSSAQVIRAGVNYRF
ncbi:outer membrane protein [Chelatococcus asaccharovorans]|uniref:Outer membrane immunogenic protein n=1 Tax=Chelatococcus asaccharovorans TaxID=28210 RepID=A0A2V3U5T0_9HYPH|nr:outer membrane beta-barrel protein [Chelatococcus asaccharovorans]MBS7702957.1 porin family protein [Chelatococcus asaccharovorans]PXW57256.1 outer membrane immunogenic protein [Chelatococcus asaccharovorans]